MYLRSETENSFLVIGGIDKRLIKDEKLFSCPVISEYYWSVNLRKFEL